MSCSVSKITVQKLSFLQIPIKSSAIEFPFLEILQAKCETLEIQKLLS